MDAVRSVRCAVAAGVVAAGLVVAGVPGAVAVPSAPSSARTSTSAYGQLHRVVELSAERLATADLVAAAKWESGAPIDDPERERQVLRTVRQQAEEAGGDPADTARVFRDQIEANKDVQRGLHQQWGYDPAQAPSEVPDLDAVRADINRVTAALVRALAAAVPVRSAPSCDGLLTAGAAQVRLERRLDQLHADALDRALASVCGTRG